MEWATTPTDTEKRRHHVDIRELFVMSNELEERVVAHIGEGQWGLLMPREVTREPMTVEDVVRFHIWDYAWIPDGLAGKTLEEIGDAHAYLLKLVREELKSNFTAHAQSAIGAVLDQNDLDRLVHLSYGYFPAREYLFSHFIPCGVWEAIYILEGLLKNTSDLQPTTVHGDTQAQSTPVFGLAHLLGIKLMPRIRNWKDLTFFRPATDVHYKHIEALFTDTVDWELIETHWQDLLQVVLSVKAGVVSSALLLRKLGTYSRRNRLYQAFAELGRVIRTVFLLEYLSSAQIREQITASTNKVEAYHRFAKWLFFGGEGLLLEIHPDEQEKRLKYNHLLTNAVAIQNVIDLTRAVRALVAEGYPVKHEDLATLSPYQTRHIKRFGDYVFTVTSQEPFDGELATLVPDETSSLRVATA
jgi:TnpA family transposase